VNEYGKAAAAADVVAEKNDVVVEATEEKKWHAYPRYETTTNTPTKRALPGRWQHSPQ
jgi:hypothetical protein